MQRLAAVLLTVLLGVLVHGQDNCTNNPCQRDGVCTLKPNGDPFCECTESNEGEFCEVPSVGACADTTRNYYGAKQGTVTSQDFPALYPNSQNCPYFIGVADAKKIEITFNFLQLEDAKDELAIGMGSVADFQKATYTFDLFEYNPLPKPVELIGDRIWLNLFTDQNQQRMGFNISYRIDGDECSPNPCLPGEMCTDLEYSYTCTNIDTGLCTPNPCQNNGLCSVTPTGAPYCACVEGFEGDYCQIVSPGSCSDVNRNFYNQREGQITSPNFPMNYPNNEDCAYFIGAPDAKKIEITYHSLGLQEMRDNVTIGGGSFVDNAASLASYSMSSVLPLPIPLDVIGNRAWINLKTDSAGQNTGFNVSWRIDGDECLPKPCLPRETCMDIEFGFICEQPIALSCNPNPCKQNAVCEPKPITGSPYCLCPVSYQGDFCQTEIVSSCNDVNRNFYGKREGLITSPGFPSPYPNNQDCSYFVGVPDAKKVEITINALSLEGVDELTLGNGSVADYRENLIAFGAEGLDASMGMPFTIEIPGDRAWLNLYTDVLNTREGFSVSYRIDGDECLPKPCLPGETCMDIEFGYICEQPVALSCNPNPCKQNAVCESKPITGSPYCLCPVNYQGDFCQTEIVSSCNDVNRNFYGKREGLITSPGFPSPYPNNQNCSYFVGVPDAKKVEITIHALSLEGVDELSLGNGSVADYRENLIAFGAEGLDASMGMPFTYEIQGDRAWLNLYTDVLNTREGFSVSYRIDGDECLSNPCANGAECLDLEYTFACQVVEVPVTTSAPVTNPTAGDDSDSSEDGAGGVALGGGGDDSEDDSEEQTGGANAKRRPNNQRKRRQRRKQKSRGRGD